MISILDLTKSKLRRKIFQYFFTNHDGELYLREIARKFNEDPSNLSKELLRLEKENIFTSSLKGNQKYYKLNTNHPLFKELKSIVFKTIGIKGSLENLVNETTGIITAFIYGSYAKDSEATSSVIDVCMIIDKDKFKEQDILPPIQELELQLSREIKYIYYSVEEWKEKISIKDSFTINIMIESKIVLKGNIGGE